VEQLKERIDALQSALERLGESLSSFASKDLTANPVIHTQIRDSVIKRFEFCVDLFWKCLKDYLYQKYGVNVASPKSSFREC
jgi:hypothetical protein